MSSHVSRCFLIVFLSVVFGRNVCGREVVEFDSDWRFAKGDFEPAREVDFDDQAWQHVDVPHDWAIEGPFDKSHPASGDGGYLPTGVCWYRKALPLPPSWQGKRVFIEFDGVMANSDVWINGQHLGHRPNGYVSFRYDLTEHLNFGEGAKNVIAVRADTSAQVASRWYTGTGIYRHVRLVAIEPLHIEFKDYGGVFVTTPEISDKQATVNLTSVVSNQSGVEQSAAVTTQIVNPSGAVVGEAASTVRLSPSDAEPVTQSLAVSSPALWSLDSPDRYTAITSVRVEDRLVDKLSTRFGIRRAKFDADRGFSLNGKKLKIKGVCLHHCGGAFGAAVPLSVWEHRLGELRKLGVNAVRTAHNPVAPEFLDLCDRMGFLVMDEFFDCWTVGKRRHDYHRHFQKWGRRDMRDTILRDRNHPSVVLYSVGNEIRDTPKEALAKGILKGLVEACHESDPTRPVTQALFRPNASHDYDNGLADMLDVIGTNYRDLELLQAWRDNPARKIIGTEQSHDRKIWLACRNNPQHAGQFLWVGIDYLGESRRWPVTTFNTGLLDRTGLPHPRAYERQSWWSDAPMVHIFRREAQTEDTPVDPGYETLEWKRRQVLYDDWTPRNLEPHSEKIEVYSNCEEVELLLGGESLGNKSLPENAAPRTWQVDFSPGQLVAVGINGGQEVARHELHTAGPAQGIVLTSNRSRLATGWDEVAQLEAQVVDAQGNFTPRAAREIVFKVAGPGRIVAVDNGAIVSHESFQADRRLTRQGRCVAFLRAAGDDDAIVVTVESAGLDSASVRLNSSR